MKPTFALSLSFEGISLLHRCAGGWRNAGEVALEAPDLTAALSGLRGAAARLETGPLYTKLIIPNDQIRYLSIETGQVDPTERDAMVRASLEGATPYAVSELVYDISIEGPTTHIAAVARETLAEAEGFAAEHDFGPLSFVAIPGSKPFLGEPYFGPTKFAQTHLPAQDPVEPDGVAVVVIGPAQFPVQGMVEPAPPAPRPVTAPPAADPIPAPQPEVPTEPKAPAPADTPAAPQPTAPAEPEPAPSAGLTFSSRRRRGAPPADPAPEPAEAPASPQASPPASVPEPTAARTAQPEPTTTEPVQAQPAPPQLTPVAPAIEQVDPAPASQQLTARRLDAAVQASGVTQAPAVAPAPAIAPAIGAAQRPPAFDPAEPPAQDTPSRFGGLLRNRRKSKPKAQPEPRAQEPIPAQAAAPTPQVDVSGMPPRLAAAVLKTADTAAVMPDESDRMTVFGARQSTKAKAAPRPRFLGLILTAVLLLFLAGVAAWASIFLDEDSVRLFSREPATKTADSTTQIAPAAPQTQTTTSSAFDMPRFSAPEIGNDRALQTPIEPEQPVILASLDPSTSDLTGAHSSLIQELRAPRSLVSLQDSETANDFEKRYAVTGIWSEAPPEPDTPSIIGLNDLFIGSIDNRDLSQDAVALPGAQDFLTDEPLFSQNSPVAPETVFDFDERGLVRATPDGALSPEGHMVFLGRPPQVPPPTPDRSVVEPEPEAQVDRLAGFRPRSRPGDLNERVERAQLGGLTRSELAGVRPKLRPASLQELAMAARAEAAAQDDAQADATDQTAEAGTETETTTDPNAFDNPTKLAVATASRPKDRPRDFKARVKKQQENPENAAVAQTVAPRTVKPKIPTNASVSRQATLTNAINMRQVNLIGVYGTPSNRRALVRMPSGRYKKVQVGDNIDGGRVSAIGDSELRYQKGGRNLVLKIPSG